MIKRHLVIGAIMLVAATSFARAQNDSVPAIRAAADHPSTQEIFDEAFRRWQSYPLPRYAVWTDTWHIRKRPMGYYTGEQSSVEVHRYAVRLSDGMENVSDPLASGRLPIATIEPEFLGPFAWTTRSSVRVAPATTGVMMQPDVESLKTIANVVAVAQSPYVIGRAANEAVTIENVDGHVTYHLQLRPRGNPERHNLRDLWIDVRTFDLWKAHFVGRYSPAPGAPVSATDVTVNFRNVLGCWVISHALWTWDDPPIAFVFEVESDEIGLPTALPDWLFDPHKYREHQSAGEPDYLGALLGRMRAAASPSPGVSATPNG